MTGKNSYCKTAHGWAAGLCVLLSLYLCVQLCLYPAADAGAARAVHAPTAAEGLFPEAGVGVSTSAQAHILMEADDGVVLAQKQADVRLPMASTTKIMTALVALESLSPDTVVSVAEEAVGVEGSSVYLIRGEQLTLMDLLYALLLESANDAAAAIACAVSGSVSAFADKMNGKAASLGLCNTHFVNPHGLDDPDHYTTARELAIITREALKQPVFREIVATRQHIIPLHGEGVRTLVNHNKLLRLYDGCIGVKTGYTKHTGRCLVSAAERDGVTLIAVTLGCPDDWNDHTALLDYGFSRVRRAELIKSGSFSTPLWVESGTAEYVMVGNTDSLSALLPAGITEVEAVVELPRFAYAPIRAGQRVGRLVYVADTENGRVTLGEVPLYAVSDVTEAVYRKTLWDIIRGWFSSRPH